MTSHIQVEAPQERSDTSSTVKIIPVPPQEIPVVFPNVKALLEKALDDGFSIEDIYVSLLRVNSILWLMTDEEYNIHGALVAEVIQYPRMKTIRVTLVGGKGLSFCKKPMIEALVAWGKNVGAKRIEEVGRKGWERVLMDEGFKYHSTFLVKEI